MVGIDEYMSVTDDEIYEAKAGRDYDAGSVYEQMLPSETANISADQIAAMVSADAHDMILKFEVTGRSFYESRYRNPIWPGLASGITVGIGFDVGHHSELDFETAWKGILPEPAYSQLGETVGVTGASAKMLLDNVAEVDIDWQTALRVYHGFTVPKFGRMTANAFPNSKALPPQCFGALLSLVYNRGPSMKGEKRVHMRNIRQHLLDGKPHLVPAEIRAMKSIWPPTFSGLHKRREAEAKLFDRGLFGRDRLVAMAA